MGGNNAWRKRVQNGLLAKEGGGGAICRHRPRFGRQGIVITRRKGELEGGSNKKKKIRARRTVATSAGATARPTAGIKNSNGSEDVK
jgi:hypothetical protein